MQLKASSLSRRPGVGSPEARAALSVNARMVSIRLCKTNPCRESVMTYSSQSQLTHRQGFEGAGLSAYMLLGGDAELVQRRAELFHRQVLGCLAQCSLLLLHLLVLDLLLGADLQELLGQALLVDQVQHRVD